jgi:hypothetical protein
MILLQIYEFVMLSHSLKNFIGKNPNEKIIYDLFFLTWYDMFTI